MKVKPKPRFKAEDRRLLNWYYARVFKSDVLRSIQHTRQEEKRITQSDFVKRFWKWLHD